MRKIFWAKLIACLTVVVILALPVKGLRAEYSLVVWNLKEHRRSLPTTENRIKVITEGDFLVISFFSKVNTAKECLLKILFNSF